MTRIISFTAILTLFFGGAVWSQGLTYKLNTKTIKVFESSTKTWQEVSALFNDNEIYLPMKFLVPNFGLVRKDLSKGKVGICLNDLCVPFSKGDESQSIQFYQDQEYVPIQHLFKALNGTCIVESEPDALLLNLQNQHFQTNELSDAPVDFSLTDMQGNLVSLSDFRGKKVIVFAWASW